MAPPSESRKIPLDNNVPMVHDMSMLNGGRMTKELGEGWRMLMIGEIVRLGDMLQISGIYFPVDGSEWVGDKISNTGPFSRVWRRSL